MWAMFPPRPVPKPAASPETRARVRLGLSATAPVSAETLTEAFRRAALTAHPDRPGGDAERFRAVVEAYRLLKRTDEAVAAALTQVARKPTSPARPPVSAAPRDVFNVHVEIDPLTAVRGGLIGLNIAGKTRQARAPAGVRHGDRLRLMLCGGGVVWAIVRVTALDDLRVEGADLVQDVPIHPRKLAEGGRFTIQTHAGPRDLWLARARPAPLRYALKDLGLPSLNGRPAGRLIVRLIPSAAEPTPAEAMLDRFEADWAAPLAA